VVLTRLREAGVTLNLEKCTWFSDEVEYLGHIVRPGQLHVHNKNVDALKHASFPTTKAQLKIFLGMCNVYRHFVKDFAKLAKPLNAVTRAEVPPDLPKRTDAALAAFDDLQQALLAPVILALPKAKGQIITGCYWSRGLSPSEKNYSKAERECLGVVWSVLKLRPFLDGHRFLIRTDHQALSWLFSTTDSSRRMMRWRLRLSEYAFDMQYKPSESHHAPDVLSRPDNDAAVKDINDDILCLALGETADGLLTGRYTGTDIPPPVEYDDIMEAQQTNALCVDLAKRVARKTAKAFPKNESHGIYRRAPYGDQLVIPKGLRELILTLEHHAAVSAHPGMNRMYYAMRRR